MLIAPSILSADFAKLGEEIQAVQNAGADWLHIDVMDGHFVPNLTFGPPVIEKIRPCTSLPFDVHLMITGAEDSLESYANAGADSITIHAEAVKNLPKTLQRIKALGKKAGVSLKPETSPDAIKPYLSLLDVILVMTVEPGFGGQSFMEDQLPKIQTLAEWVKHSKQDIHIEVDGGINLKTISNAAKAGANVCVSGSDIFKAQNYKTQIEKLRKAAYTNPC